MLSYFVETVVCFFWLVVDLTSQDLGLGLHRKWDQSILGMRFRVIFLKRCFYLKHIIKTGLFWGTKCMSKYFSISTSEILGKILSGDC